MAAVGGRQGDTLGAGLERERLALRATRVERLLAVLRGRIATPGAEARERTALERTAREYERELAALRARLHR